MCEYVSGDPQWAEMLSGLGNLGPYVFLVGKCRTATDLRWASPTETDIVTVGAALGDRHFQFSVFRYTSNNILLRMDWAKTWDEAMYLFDAHMDKE